MFALKLYVVGRETYSTGSAINTGSGTISNQGLYAGSGMTIGIAAMRVRSLLRVERYERAIAGEGGTYKGAAKDALESVLVWVDANPTRLEIPLLQSRVRDEPRSHSASRYSKRVSDIATSNRPLGESGVPDVDSLSDGITAPSALGRWSRSRPTDPFACVRIVAQCRRNATRVPESSSCCARRLHPSSAGPGR